MARHLRPETPDFLTGAPVRLRFSAVLAASPEAVFRELAEIPEGWPRWFRPIASVEYVGDPPYGRGSCRRVRLVGGGRFVESVLVAEEGRRFVYRVDETSVPGLLALMEEWRLSPSPYGGTRLQWTTALAARRPARQLWSAARPLLARAFRRAARRLDERIAEQAAG
ncbi:SRPBCC family protein [Peterkaempfera bronchialis]|uniref:SRPBCC family protein n=1 Tax=Peterkaempfera bronchialis TaxID=2126346 RepID=A0A345SSG1_9ACTN|nr:SRPBCC family protein [Peterkaempfera bronchialis]AXI76666.1 SRPBCC family protein [Peterkaempfera bronchialis]